MMKWFKKILAKRIKDEKARNKTLATIDNKPWIDVIEVNFDDPNNPNTGFFELDWNDAFIEKLKEAGYSGRKDEDIVDMWFSDLCRGVLDRPPE